MNFVRYNLDGVLNAGKKSVMNQYLNDTLADTTHRTGEKYRDDHHHPFVFDVITAGSDIRPSFNREWLSTLGEWTWKCNEFCQVPLVQHLLALADTREYEEDISCFSTKTRRSSSCYSDSEERKERSRSISGGSELCEGNTSNSLPGRLDACIKRTSNMDLSTAQRASENSIWLSKEIRGVRKKLKQISHLLDSQAKSIILTAEENAKVDRRAVLEAELSVYESAMEEVKKRIKELCECNEDKPSPKTTQEFLRKEGTTAKVSFYDEKGVECNENKSNVSCDDHNTPDEDAKIERVYFCDLCGVKCSDKSNLLLHQNGRKHRNRAEKVSEEEKKQTAASIMEQNLRDEMKNPSKNASSSKLVRRNVWGTSSTPPKFKLPPPPHPVVPQVITPLSNKGLTCELKIDTKKEDQAVTITSLLPPVSNFEDILNKSKQVRKVSSQSSKNPGVTPIWDSSPDSSRCVPLSLYASPDVTATGNRGSLSLGDFLSPSRQNPPPSSKTALAPWLTPVSAKCPSSRSLMEIQAEEANLKSREDKSSGSVGGQWFVERRERASSLLEIQEGARQEQEERLLIAEQFEIEAQIMEENRKLKEENEKRIKRSQRRSKKIPTSGGKPKRSPNIPADESSKSNATLTERQRPVKS